MKEVSIYIHIPFCHHKCVYCDFYSIINNKNVIPYFKAIEQEIRYFSEIYKNEASISTIFFGGGTPSMIEPVYIGKIIKQISNSFSVQDDVEITLESNPGTLNRRKLEELLAIGINRLSIGVQSFDNEDLQFLTRIHNSSEAIDSVITAGKTGFTNINIDLMFSLPSQTFDIWKQNLQTAVELPVNHISAYSLTLESGTPLFFKAKKGLFPLTSIEHDADNYEYCMEFLAGKGFEQYEVSNFAKKGKECKHNINYWSHKNYLGFGPSAHSFWEDTRWANYSALSFYLASVSKKKNAIMNEEVLTPTQMYNERVFLGLRSNGINLKRFEEEFEINIYESEKRFFDDLIKNKFIVITDDNLKLTSKGYLICDEICSQLTI